MTDTETAKPAPAMDWHAIQEEMVRQIRTEGRPVSGWKAGEPVLLLTTVGAKSGEQRMSPVNYSRDGEAYVVTASKGGAPTHPGWYHKLLAHPEATVEVERQRFRVHASVTTGDERQRLWDSTSPSTPRGSANTPRRRTARFR